MPRQLSILVFTLFAFWLWRQDAKSRPQYSRTLWIPFLWLLMLGSRPLSWWLFFFFNVGGGDNSNLEGNPINALFYGALIVGSIVVVARRGVSVESVIHRNLGLALFFGYLALTAIWAEYPVPTAKRWIKEIGAIPVLLVILTERNPIEAIKVVFTRCAFVLFTYSVLVIKYIPEIGRRYTPAGGLEVTGIAEQKNSLGTIVVVCGLLLVWQLLQHWGKGRRPFHHAPALQWAITLLMGVWLLYQCDSKTSILCLATGSAILFSTKIPLFARKPGRVVALCLIAASLFVALDSLFNVSDAILRTLGRDPTLTNRTEIWRVVREHPVNPLLGCGFLNYWDIHKSIKLNISEVELKTAHNGYLEIYLDGGVLGLFCLALMLMHTGASHARAFVRGHPFGALGFAFFSILMLANITESLYARRGPLWFCFLLFCLFTTGPFAASSTSDDSVVKSQEEISDDVLPSIR